MAHVFLQKIVQDSTDGTVREVISHTIIKWWCDTHSRIMYEMHKYNKLVDDYLYRDSSKVNKEEYESVHSSVHFI